MKISGTIDIDVTEQELGHTLLGLIAHKLDDLDDAGCDWFTNDNNITYIGNKDWEVSGNAKIAILVDAANILIYGHTQIIE